MWLSAAEGSPRGSLAKSFGSFLFMEKRTPFLPLPKGKNRPWMPSMSGKRVYRSVRSTSVTEPFSRRILTVLISKPESSNSFSKAIEGSVSVVFLFSAVGLKRRITESSPRSAFLKTERVITSSESLANGRIEFSFSSGQPMGKKESAIGFPQWRQILFRCVRAVRQGGLR